MGPFFLQTTTKSHTGLIYHWGNFNTDKLSSFHLATYISVTYPTFYHVFLHSISTLSSSVLALWILKINNCKLVTEGRWLEVGILHRHERVGCSVVRPKSGESDNTVWSISASVFPGNTLMHMLVWAHVRTQNHMTPALCVFIPSWIGKHHFKKIFHISVVYWEEHINGHVCVYVCV